jgi:hypothetical protein
MLGSTKTLIHVPAEYVDAANDAVKWAVALTISTLFNSRGLAAMGLGLDKWYHLRRWYSQTSCGHGRRSSHWVFGVPTSGCALRDVCANARSGNLLHRAEAVLEI